MIDNGYGVMVKEACDQCASAKSTKNGRWLTWAE